MKEEGRIFWLAPLVPAIALMLLATSAIRAQSPDPADVAEGMRLFQDKASCQTCHGWAGNGEKMDTQAPDGANLRETTLGRQDLITTIKCGRPGREMPAFDQFAYSDGRCYGLKEEDLSARGLDLPDPPATLQPREIEEVVDFLFAKVIGKGPMDKQKCIAFWGENVDTCNDLDK